MVLSLSLNFWGHCSKSIGGDDDDDDEDDVSRCSFVDGLYDARALTHYIYLLAARFSSSLLVGSFCSWSNSRKAAVWGSCPVGKTTFPWPKKSKDVRPLQIGLDFRLFEIIWYFVRWTTLFAPKEMMERNSRAQGVDFDEPLKGSEKNWSTICKEQQQQQQQ